MRMVLYILILALMLMAPVTRLDIAKLEPVEAVAICRKQDRVVLKTDAGSAGEGMTAYEALRDLKENTAAVVYLDTADYLLIEEGAENEAQELMQYLKKTVIVGQYAGGDVKEEAKYLDVHSKQAKPSD